jgi:hypothetical protein
MAREARFALRSRPANEQAAHFATSLVRGEPNRLGNKVRELV